MKNEKKLSSYCKKGVSALVCATLLTSGVGYGNIQILADTNINANSLYALQDDADTSVQKVGQLYLTSAEGQKKTISELKKADGNMDISVQFNMPGEQASVITNAAATIKVRGNTTSKAEKKPFNLKFSEKQNLYGMGSAKKYVLLANAYDPTLIRNAVALSLAKELGIPYTSDFAYVDVYLDGKYNGNYMLVETVEAGANRVELDLDHGDFLVQLEKERAEADSTYIDLNNEKKWISDYCFELKEPKIVNAGTAITTEQLEIQNKLQHVQDVLLASDTTMADIAKVIDLDSFVNYYIFAEYMKSVDAGYSSVYFYYKDGKLYAAPVWDFDLSMGNAGSYYTYGTRASLNYHNCCKDEYGKGAYKGYGSAKGFVSGKSFFEALLNQHGFQYLVRNRYNDVKSILTNVYADGGLIDTLEQSYQEDFARNYTVWKVRDSKNCGTAPVVENVPLPVSMRYPEVDYEDNVTYLKNWLKNRIAWLETGKLTGETTSSDKGWNVANWKKDYRQLFDILNKVVNLDADLYSNYDVVQAELQAGIVAAIEADQTGIAQTQVDAATKQLLDAYAKLKVKTYNTLTSYEFTGGIADTKIPSRDEDNAYVTTEETGLKVGSTLAGHVVGEKNRTLRWSEEDNYLDNGLYGVAPVLEPKSEVNNGAWGTKGEVYFQIETSTRGYKDLRFTAYLGASKKGARDYRLQYSLDGKTFTDVENGAYCITNNKRIEKAYDAIALPEALENQRTVYLRIVVDSDYKVNGDTGFFGGTGGEIAINHISLVSGDEAEMTYADYDAAYANAKQLDADKYLDFTAVQNLLDHPLDKASTSMTQEMIDAATDQLQEAVSKLQEKKIFTITFVKYDQEKEVITYREGDAFVFPVVARDGYTCKGWYTDAACQNPVQALTIPTEDTTYYCGWEAVTPSVEPTVVPTATPTVAPTATPKVTPTVAPTATPTVKPTATAAPTAMPTVKPTATVAPTATPTVRSTATVTLTATPNTEPQVITYVQEATNATTAPTVTVEKQKAPDNKAVSLILRGVYKKAANNKKAAEVNCVNPTEIVLYTKTYTKAKLSVEMISNDSQEATVWASSKEKVASVSDTGEVTAHNPGTTYITARVGSTSVCCKIIVQKSNLEVGKTMLVLKKGKKKAIKAGVSPVGIIAYKSSNKKVATVSKSGVIVAKRKGTAVITVSCNSLKKKIKVKVK